jgi:hypothetical protein
MIMAFLLQQKRPWSFSPPRPLKKTENKKAVDSVVPSTHGLFFLIRTLESGHPGRWADPPPVIKIIKPPAKIQSNEGSVHRFLFHPNFNH